MKRLLVYVYSEETGVFGDATKYLLEEFKKCVDRLVIVCNCYLSPIGRRKFKEITDDVYCLECKSTIQVAYSDAVVNYLGENKLTDFDEIIWMSDNFYGPFSSVEDMFAAMETKDCDYWTLTKEIIKEKFVVLRKKIFLSNKFNELNGQVLEVYRRQCRNLNKSKTADTESYINIYENCQSAEYIDASQAGNLTFTELQYYMILEKSLPLVQKEMFHLTYYELLTQFKTLSITGMLNKIQAEHADLLVAIEDERKKVQSSKKVAENNILNVVSKDLQLGKVYPDYGTEYSEVNRCEGYNFMNQNGDFIIKFKPEFERKIQGFRYDPIEKIKNLLITIYSCKCDNVDLVPNHHNGKNCGELFYFFETDDPSIEYRIETEYVKEIVIQGNMQILNDRFSDYINSSQITSYVSSIYWDDGNGFNEINKITMGLYVDKYNEFDIRAVLNVKNIKAIRFDPLEKCKCMMRIVDISSDDKELIITETNGKKKDEKCWSFNNFDPYIKCKVQQTNIYSIHIQGQIEIVK